VRDGHAAATRRKVPADVAVAGFDDVPAAAHSGPAVTTASDPVERIVEAGRQGSRSAT